MKAVVWRKKRKPISFITISFITISLLPLVLFLLENPLVFFTTFNLCTDGWSKINLIDENYRASLNSQILKAAGISW